MLLGDVVPLLGEVAPLPGELDLLLCKSVGGLKEGDGGLCLRSTAVDALVLSRVSSDVS